MSSDAPRVHSISRDGMHVQCLNPSVHYVVQLRLPAATGSRRGTRRYLKGEEPSGDSLGQSPSPRFQVKPAASVRLRPVVPPLGLFQLRSAVCPVGVLSMAVTDASEAPEAQETSSTQKSFNRPKRPDRPDLPKLKADIDVLQAQINQHKSRIEEIGKTLSDRRGNRQGSGEQQKLKARLNDLIGQFKRELVCVPF